jgi:hypothetical protein
MRTKGVGDKRIKRFIAQNVVAMDPCLKAYVFEDMFS